MSIKEGRDYLLLIWKQPKTRSRYIIGELSKNGQFEFSYGYEVNAAITVGFELLIAFPNIEKVYENENLFSVFVSRLPDPKRKGIETILNKYGLTEYNSYELLKRSGARLPIDNLEFIDPIFDFEKGKVVRKFFVAGSRYHLGCEGEDCEKSVDINLNEELYLASEPENEFDKYAIKILNESGTLIGYVPRYYSKIICQLMVDKITISCRVIEINKDMECNECIKVELTISTN
ncbi:MAG: HIRAN domain-containing protein [Eubacteriales bacterium]